MKITNVSCQAARIARSNVPANFRPGSRHFAPWENQIRDMVEIGMTSDEIISQIEAMETASVDMENPKEARTNRAFTDGRLTLTVPLSHNTLVIYLSQFRSEFNIKRRDKRIQQAVKLVDIGLELHQAKEKIAELELKLINLKNIMGQALNTF